MMLLNKDKPVVSVSALIHNTGASAGGGAGAVQRQAWTGPLWSDHSPAAAPHTASVVVSGVAMSGGGGGMGRLSPPLTPMEGLAVPLPTGSGGNNFSHVNSNGPASPGLSTPTFTIGSPGSSSSNTGFSNSSSQSSSYPPNHPLSGSKHLCAICEDRASGKHYGVFSCEGCKGFFKRTVRKELQYACRETRACIIDKRHRNRCQYCRYNKCLSMGMKREAVQEERQRTKAGGGGSLSAGDKEGGPDSVGGSGVLLEMPIASIREAELLAEIEEDTKPQLTDDDSPEFMGFAARRQLDNLVKWAKLIPHFRDLPVNDQMLLLKNGWNELIIASFSHRSINCTDGIMLSEGLKVTRSNAHPMGVSLIYDRVLTELVAKMRDMNMDKIEVGCLRSIVLYNPDVKGLSCSNHIECLRERVYSALEEYTKSKSPEESGRFPKLLLRLPALRSIGLRCLEHLFYYKMFCDDSTPIESYIADKLEELTESL